MGLEQIGVSADPPIKENILCGSLASRNGLVRQQVD